MKRILVDSHILGPTMFSGDYNIMTSYDQKEWKTKGST